MAQRKDHIKVFTHADSHQTWLLILNAHDGRRVRVECPQMRGVQVSASPLGVLGDLGYVKARQVLRGTTKKLARNKERYTFLIGF